jgi:hypothetical protein
VHLTTLALTVTVGSAGKLRHGSPEVAAFGEQVPVASMRAGDEVALVKCKAGAYRDSFLPLIGVGVAWKGALAKLTGHLLLEGSNLAHLFVSPKRQLVSAKLVGRHHRVWPSSSTNTFLCIYAPNPIVEASILPETLARQ